MTITSIAAIVIIATIVSITAIGAIVRRQNAREKALPVWMFQTGLLLNELAELHGGKPPAGWTVDLLVKQVQQALGVRVSWLGFDDKTIQESPRARQSLSETLANMAEEATDPEVKQALGNLSSLLLKW